MATNENEADFVSSTNDIVDRISECLLSVEGEVVAQIANDLLGAKLQYLGDDLFLEVVNE